MNLLATINQNTLLDGQGVLPGWLVPWDKARPGCTPNGFDWWYKERYGVNPLT